MTHKLDITEHNARENARTELGQDHIPVNTLPGLRDRVDLIELVIGINQT